MLAQGNALGYSTRAIVLRPEGAQGPPAPSARARLLALYPGRCPGLASSAPLARHRSLPLDASPKKKPVRLTAVDRLLPMARTHLQPALANSAFVLLSDFSIS